MYRQGDLLIIKVDTIPTKAKTHDKVLLYGETTGHAHRLDGDADVVEVDTNLFFTVRDMVDLTHEEHETITIPQGQYRVIRQREYDEGEIRYVSD